MHELSARVIFFSILSKGHPPPHTHTHGHTQSHRTRAGWRPPHPKNSRWGSAQRCAPSNPPPPRKKSFVCLLFYILQTLIRPGVDCPVVYFYYHNKMLVWFILFTAFSYQYVVHSPCSHLSPVLYGSHVQDGAP